MIELLVVIVIIILLGTISVVALNDQRATARDSQRISDIRQIRTALEFYRNDAGSYPVAQTPLILGVGNIQKLCSKAEDGFVSSQTSCADAGTFMSNIPADPLSGQKYVYTGSADGYDIVFKLEKPNTLGPAGIYHAHSQTIDTEAGNK